jgi:hypothetical protein
MTGRFLLAFLSAACCLPAQRLPEDFDVQRAEREGRALTAELLSRVPANSFTNTGTIVIKARRAEPVEIPARFVVLCFEKYWVSGYEAFRPEPGGTCNQLTIVHEPGAPSRYFQGTHKQLETATPLSAAELATLKFAGSDFWACDLGLEFLHWPVQRLLKKDMVRGQSCNVLESLRSEAPDGAYHRVVSWLDIDTGGIVLATAYDADGRVMKEFVPKRFKKVNGEWHLIEMRIEDRTTKSRTTIIFDLSEE